MDAAELDSAQAEHGSRLLMYLQRMRATQGLTDVVLLTEGVAFHCHKVVLCAFSAYFQVESSSRRLFKSHGSQARHSGLLHVSSGHVYMWSEGNPRS